KNQIDGYLEEKESTRDANDKPILVEQGYNGFNIIKYGMDYYAVLQSLGDFNIDFFLKQQDIKKQYLSLLSLIMGDSLEQIKKMIDNNISNSL
ncbi:hypothetical protein ACFL4O_03395, partial [bacterium]